jgi:hypothetical protein
MFSNVGFSCQNTQLKCAQPPPFTVVMAPPIARQRTQLRACHARAATPLAPHARTNTSLDILHCTHADTRVWGLDRRTHGSLLRLFLHSMQKYSSSSPGTSTMLAHLLQRRHKDNGKQQQQQQHSLLMQGQSAAVAKDDGVILQRLLVPAHRAGVAVVRGKPATQRHSEASCGDGGITSCRSR